MSALWSNAHSPFGIEEDLAFVEVVVLELREVTLRFSRRRIFDDFEVDVFKLCLWCEGL